MLHVKDSVSLLFLCVLTTFLKLEYLLRCLKRLDIIKTFRFTLSVVFIGTEWKLKSGLKYKGCNKKGFSINKRQPKFLVMIQGRNTPTPHWFLLGAVSRIFWEICMVFRKKKDGYLNENYRCAMTCKGGRGVPVPVGKLTTIPTATSDIWRHSLELADYVSNLDQCFYWKMLLN